MSDKSPIEWTDATWNPTTGCTKISPGCAHCYIERTPAFRIPGNRFVHGKTDLTIFHDRLEQPLHWRKPRRVFVNSLSDLFHNDISDAFIDRVFAVMALAPQHTFQVLTKRAERMRRYVTERNEVGSFGQSVWAQMYRFRQSPSAVRWPLPNVWLGVSVENQPCADERIPLLLQTPAAVRFISAEPLLESISLTHIHFVDRHYVKDSLRRSELEPPGIPDARLDWVIVGGESGPKARPFDLAWARSIVAQCRSAGVPVFVKQLGAHALGDMPAPLLRRLTLIDKKGGDIDEFPADLRVREFPTMVNQPQPAPAVPEAREEPIVPLRDKTSSSSSS